MEANQYIREVEVKFKTKPREQDKVKIKSALDAVNLFKDLQSETQEKVIAIHIDIHGTVSCFQVVFIGTSTATLTDPKPILRTSLLTNSRSLILIHNHPSGDPHPSTGDITIKNQLQGACKTLNVQLLDYIIIGDDSIYYSFADEGNM